MSALAAILAITAAAFITALAIYGGFTLLDHIEAAVNARAFRKPIDKRLSEISERDWSAVSNGFHDNGGYR